MWCCAGNRAVFLVVAVQLRVPSFASFEIFCEKIPCHDCLLKPMNLRKEIRPQRSRRAQLYARRYTRSEGDFFRSLNSTPTDGLVLIVIMNLFVFMRKEVHSGYGFS
jgi:hypothetical protein